MEGSIRSRERISAIGAELGFKFDYFDEMRMYNTFKAHQLVNYAGDYDKSQDVSIKLFEAFFGQRQNISDIEILVKIADSVGLPDDNVRKVLEEESRAMAVRTRQRYWTDLRVSSVPTVVIRPSFAVSGAQGVDTYSKILLGAQRN
ncbi:DsbA family oxidoreductase [Ruegeria arenilitoris]|uniref:DsbA family oxidoreductase n=1 Tax=Ruegeria arenilitoris TaxID=1173585 RepID=UPI00147997BC|nr:DsbA family protein [Ruegeria arenilitoris]